MITGYMIRSSSYHETISPMEFSHSALRLLAVNLTGLPAWPNFHAFTRPCIVKLSSAVDAYPVIHYFSGAVHAKTQVNIDMTGAIGDDVETSSSRPQLGRLAGMLADRGRWSAAGFGHRRMKRCLASSNNRLERPYDHSIRRDAGELVHHLQMRAST